MKNQYVGDINDYRKYGLLRVLTDLGRHPLATCWMLTADDGRTDGRKIGYLQDPGHWRGLDPPLFDALHRMVGLHGQRDVNAVEAAGILPGARFDRTLLTDSPAQRREHMRNTYRIVEGTDLAFFDPDNGIEIASKPYGRKHSCKHLYWREIEEAYRLGPSLLIYQHFRRIKRDIFIADLARALQEHTGARTVHSFRTSHVVFLLVTQRRHEAWIGARSEVVADHWAGQIHVARHGE